MGPDLLGRRTLLSARGHRDSEAHWEPERLGRCTARGCAVGGTVEAEWPLPKALQVGDDATGVPVLSELYEKMKASPFPVDLGALWKELGVTKKNGLIRFNDSAPLAAIRRAITTTTRHDSFTGQENNRDRLQMQQGPKSSY